MASAIEIVQAIYEISTVVTDVILNNEYIKRGWKEEYTLSIAFLVFNGLVMAVVGLQIERKEAQRRYVNIAWLNAFIGGVIGLLQLRVLAETVHTYLHEKRSSDKHQDGANRTAQSHTLQPRAHGSFTETREQAKQRVEHGLVYVTFLQAMVRDVPLFIIQANATIHYRKWKLVDLWAVGSTGITLLNAVAGYVTLKHYEAYYKSASKTLNLGATVFLLGQFVFRLGAILLVATTTGYTVVAYALAITCIGIISAIALQLADESPSYSSQVAKSVLMFPLFAVFTLDAGKLAPPATAKESLFSRKLLCLNAWRVLENCVGVLLAIAGPRYTDFGESTDQEITIIGGACAGFYLVCFVVFAVVARLTSGATSQQSMQEDTQLYLRNQPQQYQSSTYAANTSAYSVPQQPVHPQYPPQAVQQHRSPA